MDVKKWGPCYWYTLHTMAFEFPKEPSEEQKKFALNFISKLYLLLPCSKCSKHYKKMIEDHPPSIDTFASNETFSKYMVFLHNEVNKRLQKKVITYEDAYTLYKEKKVCQKCSPIKNPTCNGPTRKKMYWISLGVVSLTGIIVLFTMFQLLKSSSFFGD